MHQALYRKWRPKSFDDVVGQEHITSVLTYEVDHKVCSHAYLFCGSRGTGKTTCAKILAKALNCEHPVGGNPCGVCDSCRSIEEETVTDILEMDAASNNSVDNIRDIREEVVYSPSMLKYRVYIIDEVHMLSGSAFNALLKTLEEPPAHVVFILATTELQKLPATIISRCQHFEFRRIAVPALVSQLQKIARAESMELDEEAAVRIARHAQGGMRDAISLLELCAGNRQRITVDAVDECVGSVGRENTCAAVQALLKNDSEAIFSLIASIVASARDLLVFWQDLLSLYRDLLIIKTSSHPMEYLDLTDHETEEPRAIADQMSREKMLYHLSVLEDTLVMMQKSNAIKRVLAETALLRLCDETLTQTPEAMLLRISQLETALKTLSLQPVAAPAPKKEEEKSETKATSAAPAEEKKPAPKAEPVREKKETEEVPAPAPAQRRILPSFPDVLDKVAMSDPMTSSFLRNAKAYLDEEDHILIEVSEEFALTMIESGRGKEYLRSALSSELGRDLPESAVRLSVAPKKSEKNSRWDSLTEN